MKYKTVLSGALAAALLLSMMPAGAETLPDETEAPAAAEVVTEETSVPAETEVPAETGAPAETEAPEETEPEMTFTPYDPETPEETAPLESMVVEKYWTNTENVFTDEHRVYMSGYGSGYFGPDDTLTWGAVCTMVYSLLDDQSTGSAEYTLTNTPEGEWYSVPMEVLASRGLLTDDPDPESNICRGDFVELLCNCAVVDVDGVSSSFSDVPEDSEWYIAVSAAVTEGWISGYPDGTFGAEKSLTRAEAAIILNHALGRSMDSTLSGDHSACRSLRDVPEGSWYYNAIMEASTVHTADVDEDGTEHWTSYTPVYAVTFDVKGTVTTEYVTMGETPWMPSGSSSVTHWMVSGSAEVARPDVTTVSGDASYTAWYAPALKTDHTQYVAGTGNGCFSPDASVTRAEAAQMLYSMLADQSKGSYNCCFTDVSSGSWYYNAVITLATKGLINDGGAFRPDDPMTRGEFVELLTRLVPYTNGEASFTDVSGDNAAIATAAAKGWISGYPDGTFGAENSLTRAEAVVIFNNILKRTGDKTTESLMDSRYTFTDVSKYHWAYYQIMEAATTHSYTASGSGESWSTYTHQYTASVSWESSASVVAAASITNNITSTYSGNYDHNYNWDYSTETAENYVNSKGYSSSTSYLLWVSRQNQKVYCFMGSKGNWKLYRTMICGTGKASTPTPTGVTYITYRQESWQYTSDIVYHPVRFYPNTGYAFHSRLHNYGSGYYDASIGFPVSHGCVRMLDEDINFIYYYVPNNTTVVIY